MALSFNQLLFTTLHHRHLAIVGLAHAGGTVRQIAEDTGLERTTVYRVLKSIGNPSSASPWLAAQWVEPT